MPPGFLVRGSKLQGYTREKVIVVGMPILCRRAKRPQLGA